MKDLIVGLLLPGVRSSAAGGGDRYTQSQHREALSVTLSQTIIMEWVDSEELHTVLCVRDLELSFRSSQGAPMNSGGRCAYPHLQDMNTQTHTLTYVHTETQTHSCIDPYTHTHKTTHTHSSTLCSVCTYHQKLRVYHKMCHFNSKYK